MSDSPVPRVADYAAREQSRRSLAARPLHRSGFLEKVSGLQLRPMKIVCHAGNGCAGPVIDLLEDHLPFEFIKIDHLPDPEPAQRDPQSASA